MRWSKSSHVTLTCRGPLGKEQPASLTSLPQLSCSKFPRWKLIGRSHTSFCHCLSFASKNLFFGFTPKQSQQKKKLKTKAKPPPQLRESRSTVPTGDTKTAARRRCSSVSLVEVLAVGCKAKGKGTAVRIGGSWRRFRDVRLKSWERLFCAAIICGYYSLPPLL